ncbi:UDP-glucose dehydrogenase family protein [Hespellia stercorisuis]|uniref:UDP-glucose 6-dehydrogenase n=1 Tax=Hespellia stercorisuis DSM 15480 TaxID=1121950 RepID=A0A1M6JXS7_9FIRM|nr:UDP-glucose/GDP-mannose dehydrogenase family protein [Hespellia stercorisuis]SHJ51506.1 UDPglucose 6-dehydrogenase [Hespellia stercorisuis DSM 15480]
MKIAVAGTGYVGLVTGVCLASKGHDVTCVDIDEDKVQVMKQGISPIYEPGLSELMKENMEHLTFTTDYVSAYKDAEVIFIGVGTPEKQDGSANLTYVYQVAKQIAQSAKRDCVVVVKSTVPIGTNDKLESYIHDKQKADVNIYVASNPEFLAQGTAVKDTLHASRIVIGVESEEPGEILQRVYADFEAPKLIVKRRSAEMVKYASNDFLALKISYVNEIANLCETVGADITEVTKGMGYDARIGDRFLNAGIGYGGSCFPKDTKALSWLASFNDKEIRTVKAAIEVNDSQKFKLIKKAKKYYEDFLFLNVAILGCTFKPGTDDLREAPSLVNVPLLLEDGAHVRIWDPVGTDNFRKKIPNQKIQYCESIDEALVDADICFIFTEWDDVKKYDVQKYKQLMKTPIVLDGRNCYGLDAFENTGITYASVGRPTVNDR